MEEIKKIEVQGQQYGVADMLMRSVMGGNAQVIEWSHTHNMNDYKDAGTYRIRGERTGSPLEDNLPIMNSGSGHTIEGILYVLDSSLPNGSGKESDCTVTQFLMLSNRVGGQEGDMYMRSAYGVNKDNLTWKPWEKYQTNMEVGVVSNEFNHNTSEASLPAQNLGGMNSLIDNGIYSGIYLPPNALLGTSLDNTFVGDPSAVETFVMVVINNYAAAPKTPMAQTITQIKFAVTNGGVFSMEKRSEGPATSYSWSKWESVGGGGGNSNIDNDVYAKFDGDTLKIGSDQYYDDANTIKLGKSVVIGNGVRIKNNIEFDSYVNTKLHIGTAMDAQPSVDEVKLGRGTYIGAFVNIEDHVSIKTGSDYVPKISIQNSSLKFGSNVLLLEDDTSKSVKFGDSAAPCQITNGMKILADRTSGIKITLGEKTVTLPFDE